MPKHFLRNKKTGRFISGKNKTENRKLIKVSSSEKIKRVEKIVTRSREQRRLSAYKGVVTRTENLGKSRFTVADNLKRRYPGKYKTEADADKQAQLLLAKYLLKHKDWIKRGKRGREPKFTSP